LLLDLPLVGKKYTWFKENGSAKSKLDRVLVTEKWLQIWPMCKQYVQRREVSDHCALVVKSVDKDWGLRPFRTIDTWHMERGFNGMVKEMCQSYVVQGNEIAKLKDKLKMLKGDLKVWNRDVLGNLHTKKRDIMQEIENLDCQDVYDDPLESVRLERLELMSRLREIDSKIDSLISLKARMNWLKYGDSCTKFCHSSLRWKRLRNELKGVEVGGQWCEESCTVRLEAKKLFENRFKATKDLGVRLGAVEFKTLTLEKNLSLMSVFIEEEIKEPVWQCEGSKSPGPDWFNFSFIKKSWDYINDKFVIALVAFHETCSKGFNASFIALVPKVRDPSSFFTRQCSNASVCAFPLQPSRGSCSPKST